MIVGENIVLKVSINGRVTKEGVKNSVNVGAWLKTVLSDHNLTGDFFIDHEGRVVDKSVSIARAGLVNGAEIAIKPVAASLPPPPAVEAAASPQPPPPTPPAPTSTGRATPPIEPTTPPAPRHLARLIAVFIEGQQHGSVPIQPLVRVVVPDSSSSIVKLTRVAFKRTGCGAPLEQQTAKPSKVPGTFLVTLPSDKFLDFDQDYTFEVSCRPNDALTANRATIDFHTARQRKLPLDSDSDSDSAEQSQPVALSYADVRLMTQDFDATEAGVASRATGRLGKGAFAVVCKGLYVDVSFAAAASGECTATVAAKRVAVKRLFPSGAITMRHVQDTVRRELVALRNVRHKNIVRLLAYAEHPSVSPRKKGRPDAEDYHYDETLADVEQFPCLVYEYLPLGSLDQLLVDDARARGLSWRTRLSVLVGVAQGLRYLHSRAPAAFHRDIKSANIALDFDCTPKLIDWGLARFRSETGAGVETAVGTVMGTAVYMCPQYHYRAVEYEARCDVYSFGVVVLELLTGRLNGRKAQGRLTNFQIDPNEPPDPRCCDSWPPAVVAALRTVAAKCMQLRLEDRYASMREVLDALTQAERESVRLQPSEQEAEERVVGLQRELEALSLQRHVRERVEWMRTQHRAMEDVGRRVRCCGSACAEEYAAAEDGVACAFIRDHFFCDGCFDGVVREQLRREAELCCPVCRGHEQLRPFPLRAVARHTTDETFALFLAQREAAAARAERLQGERLLQEKLRDLETRAQQTLRRALSEQDARYERDVSALTARVAELAGQLEGQGPRRAAEDERRRIDAERRQRLQAEASGHQARVEALLRTRCPHCRGEVAEPPGAPQSLSRQHGDGDGGGGGCGGFFCARCLAACGSSDDCQRHVLSCALDPQRGSDLALALRERVARYLSDHVADAEVRALLVAGLAPVLERHGVEL